MRRYKMYKPKVGFIVYGVHKDGLADPMGTPFIDDRLIDNAKSALIDAGLELVEHDLIIASKREARDCFSKFKKMDDIDAVVLFSGTWVWAAHLIAPLRDFSFTGKGIVLWTNPGSQGWRPGQSGEKQAQHEHLWCIRWSRDGTDLWCRGSVPMDENLRSGHRLP
jgi:hypothetical protein